jgi:hypothetical protein
MSKRNIEIKVRLNRKEAEILNKRVKKSHLSREAYLRHLIDGVVPQDSPPPDYYSMMRELHGVANNLNQIAQKAHVLNVVDVQRYDAAVHQVEAAIKTITDAVILPRRMDERVV